MHIRPTSATLALSAAFGCTLDLSGVTDANTNTTTNGPTTDPDGTTTQGTGTTGETPPTTGDPTTTGIGTTTGAETGTTGDTGGLEPDWCNGFDPLTTGLKVHNNADVELVMGSELAAECGGQGTIMIPIYPHFGGFMPTGDDVTFDVILDVEGFNIGPNDHFFQAVDHAHEVDCATDPTYGYYYGSYSFIPIFPPDAIPDINVINGKAGHLSLTLHTPDGDVPLELDVVMKAQIDVCGYGGYYDTDTYGTTDAESTGGTGSTGSTG